jgi:hypothetical protein
LQRAGWTVGDVAVHGPDGIHWLVSGSNGENRIEGRGASQGEAWHRAVEQAEAVGMAGPAAVLAAPLMAVKVTAWPTTAGFTSALTEVVVPSGLIVCGEAESSPVLARKLPSPP